MLTIEDHGGLTEKRNVGSFVQFSLIPALCKKAGTLTIDELIVHKLTPRVVEGIRQLAKTVRIKKIVYEPLKQTKTDISELLTQLEQIAPVVQTEVKSSKKKKGPCSGPLVIS